MRDMNAQLGRSSLVGVFHQVDSGHLSFQVFKGGDFLNLSNIELFWIFQNDLMIFDG